MSLSGVIRGVESAKPLPAKFSLSFAYIVLSVLMIVFYKCRLGPKFVSPMYRVAKAGERRSQTE